MEVLFKIPVDLQKRFEFIPPHALSDVLACVFRKGLLAIDKEAGFFPEDIEEVREEVEETQEPTRTNQDMLQEILTIVRELKSNGIVAAESKGSVSPKLELEPEPEPEPNFDISQITESLDFEDADGLGDLLDLLK